MRTNKKEEEERCYRADTQLRCNKPLERGIVARMTKMDRGGISPFSKNKKEQKKTKSV
jgi:prolyl-tRNA editing enzyme YbaK/EbsC (Cys-tRNA(Pro) deacylase)